MRGNVVRAPALLLVVAVMAARSIASPPEEEEDSTAWTPIDSSHLKMEPRVEQEEEEQEEKEVAGEPDGKSISEISLNVESSLKVKTDGRQSYPTNPMLAPRYSVHSRKKLESLVKDSYLDALEYSHKMKGKERRTYDARPPELVKQDYAPRPVYRREDNETSGAGANGNPLAQETKSKLARISYGGGAYEVPVDTYVVPSVESTYEEPHQVTYGSEYGAGYEPQAAYGPPKNKYKLVNVHSSYGPPPPYLSPPSGHPYHEYGTPQQGLGSLQATYSTSHPLPDFFPFTFLPSIDVSWPISLKIDALTLIKIALKLIVFKIIVKFIAVICLLIFIPKLIHKKHDAVDDISRGFIEKPNFPEDQLQLLSSIVRISIEHYKTMNATDGRANGSCSDAACQIKNRLFSSDDTWADYARLFKAYVAEEEEEEEEEKEKKVEGAILRKSRSNRSRRR